MRHKGLSASVEIGINEMGSYAFSAVKIILTSQRFNTQLKKKGFCVTTNKF